MSFKKYLKDKIALIFLMTFALFTIEIFLMLYNFGVFVKIYIPVVILLVTFVSLVIDFYNRKKVYLKIKNTLEMLNEKYLLSEVIEKSNFYDGEFYDYVLKELSKSMYENVKKYNRIQQEYKEYIELWIHEIKLPITASKMIIENNLNEITKNLDEEINKIENYTEQALFYARSNTVEKDYIIKKCNLKDIINEAIVKNKQILIKDKIRLNLHNLEQEVYTDSKWILFILNQIISNAIKYSKEINKEIEIYSENKKDCVNLYIKDNGIGIKQEELEKVFEKGFTGENGRNKNKKSTGIGLYLSKKLCDKLGLRIEINSKFEEYTIIKIIFPKNSYIEMNKN